MFSERVVAHKRALLEERYASSLSLPSFSFREHSVGEVDEFLLRTKGAFAPSGEQLRSLTTEEERFILDEVSLSQIDWHYFSRRYCWILGDDRKLQRFHPWLSQEMVLAEMAKEEERQWEQSGLVKLFFSILKARQLGVSVLSASINAHQCFLYPNIRSIIASDHEDNSLKQWNVALRIYDTLPPWMRSGIELKRVGEYLRLKSGSEITVGQGNQETTVGQGMTADIIHLTEMSTWKYPRMIDEDILPAFRSNRAPFSAFLIESTGAGIGDNWFYKTHTAAERGRGFFKAMFLGWFTAKDKYSAPADALTLSEQTLEIGKRIKEEAGVEVSKEQLAWYQLTREHYEASGELDLMSQEYPSTKEEAFQSGLPTVFPLSLVTSLRSSVRTPLGVYRLNPVTGKMTEVDDPGAPRENLLTIWDLPKKGEVFTVGVDPSYGIGQDNASICVNRVGTKDRDDEQVAEWWGTADPVELALYCWTIGYIFSERSTGGLPAKMAIETNPGSPGLLTQEELRKRGYPNLYFSRRFDQSTQKWSTRIGWYTTNVTRPLLTETGIKALIGRTWKVNSPDFIREMISLVRTVSAGRQRVEAAPGTHDDLLFGGWISLFIAHEDDMLNLAEERRKENQPGVERQKGRQLRDIMAEEGLSWEDAVDMWEESMAERGLL